MCLGQTKSQERIQNMLNSMMTLHQHFKLWMQPQSVSGSYLSISKANSRHIVVSTDLAPDLSASIDPVQGVSEVFRETYNIDPHTSHLWTQTGFVTSLSCYLEPDITNPISIKIIVSADLGPIPNTHRYLYYLATCPFYGRYFIYTIGRVWLGGIWG